MDDMLMTLVDTEENGRQLFIEPQYLDEEGKWRRVTTTDRLPADWQDNTLVATSYEVANTTRKSTVTINESIQILKNKLGVK